MVYTALHYQILKVIDETYLFPLNHAFIGYLAIPTIGLTGHIYGHYARILDTELMTNYARLQESFNLYVTTNGTSNIRISCTPPPPPQMSTQYKMFWGTSYIIHTQSIQPFWWN